MLPIDYIEVTTRVTCDGDVYFGDEKLAGLIAEDSIVLRPGGPGGINRLTVTFLVGNVEVADPLAEGASPAPAGGTG